MNEYQLTPTEARIVFALIEQRERLALMVNECNDALEEYMAGMALTGGLRTGTPSLQQRGDSLILTVTPEAEPLEEAAE